MTTTTLVRQAHHHLSVLADLERQLRVPASADVQRRLRSRLAVAAAGWELMAFEDNQGVDTDQARRAWRTVGSAILSTLRPGIRKVAA